MPKNPTTKQRRKFALRSYNKLYKAVKKYAKQNNLDWDVKKTRQFTKDFVQPEFKGERDYNIRIKDVNSIIELNLRPSGGSNAVPYTRPEDVYINPLIIPPTVTTGILWFDIDEYLSVQLRAEVDPKDLRLEVNAGEYGSTGIFDLSTYEYFSTGVHDIIENIRVTMGDESEPEWVGNPVVRPSFQDDGQTNSYFLRFTLYVNGSEITPTSTADVSTAQIPVTEETLEQRRQKRKEITLRKKELAKLRRQAKKEKEARMRKRPTKKEAPKELPKEKPSKEKPKKEKSEQVLRSENVQSALERQKEMLSDTERLYKEGILTKKEFIAERKEIMETTKLAISKFKDGGLI